MNRLFVNRHHVSQFSIEMCVSLFLDYCLKPIEANDGRTTVSLNILYYCICAQKVENGLYNIQPIGLMEAYGGKHKFLHP